MKRITPGLLLLALVSLPVAPAFADDSVEIGTPAPEFELPDQDGQLHSLEDYRDQWVVLYFYPKDETPGCTTQACEFRDNIFAFRKLNAQILGVSLDDVESHKKFSENHGLPFPLLADADGKTADAYGVKTKMMGWTVAKRQTFIVDPRGNIARHYEKVDPDTHAAEVLADLETLGASATP
jgi:peroxiredoxin Q/BCP